MGLSPVTRVVMEYGDTLWRYPDTGSTFEKWVKLYILIG
jgi:hypothetical protein